MSAPLWLRAVHKLERAIGEPVEAVVHSDRYFDAVAELTRLRRKADAVAEGAARRWLHLLNLPAATDVRRLREQLSRMERRLDDVSDELAALERPADHVRWG
jgi:GTP1/Obg family GTP-binding protein